MAAADKFANILCRGATEQSTLDERGKFHDPNSQGRMLVYIEQAI